MSSDSDLLQQYQSEVDKASRKEKRKSSTPQYDSSSSQQDQESSSRTQSQQKKANATKRISAEATTSVQGFHAHNAYSIRDSPIDLTLNRRGQHHKDDPVIPKDEQYHPALRDHETVLSDRLMNRPLPTSLTLRPHRALDPNYVTPVVNKPVMPRKPLPPPPPKSKVDGVKLRPVDEILRDIAARSNGTVSATAPPPPPASRAENTSRHHIDTMPDPIKGVLQIVNDSRLMQEKKRQQPNIYINRPRTVASTSASSSTPNRAPVKPRTVSSTSASSSTSIRAPVKPRTVASTSTSSSKSITANAKSLSSARPPVKATASSSASIRAAVKPHYKPSNINAPTSSRSTVKQSIEPKVTKTPLQDVPPTFKTPLLQERKPSVSSIKGKEKAGSTEESSQLSNHPRVSGKTTPLRSTTPEQVTSPIDVYESRKILQEKEEIEFKTPGDLVTPPLEKDFGAYLRPILKVVLRKSEVSPSLLRAFPSPPPKSSATSRKQKDKGKARATLKVQKTTPVNTQKPSDAKPPPVPVLNLGIKRSVDELAAPKYNEQNLPDADLEEGETRSPSPVPTKKQKPAASSTPAIKPRPKSPRRRKSPTKKAQVHVREPSPREPSPEPIHRGRLSRREPYRRNSYRRDSSIDSTNRSKSPSRRESRRDAQSNQRRRSRSPARRDSRRGTSPVSTSRNKSPARQSLPTRDTSSVLPVRRGEETQSHASSSSLNQKQPVNVSPVTSVRRVEETQNQASSSALKQKQPVNTSPVTSVRRVEETQNQASSSALNRKQPVNTSPVTSVRRVEETQNQASSSALNRKQPVNASPVTSVRSGDETQNQASSIALTQKKPVNASPAVPVRPVENSGNHASSSAPKPVNALPAKEIEQCRIFQIMFNSLARTTKHRGDKRLKTKAGVLDHFHSLCSYIISFYYADKLDRDSTLETMNKWKSLFPLIECLMYYMDITGMSELRPLCQRLMGLIRFRVFELLKTTLPATPEEDHQRYEGISRAMIREQDKAVELYNISESSVGFAGLKRNYPKTFKDVCLVGDLKSGMILNNEDGGVSSPFVPFGTNGSLHLAAIAARCIITEYAKSSHIEYSPIVNVEDFM